MNIAILTDRYFPTPVSGAVLMHDMALELVSKKHNVLVLTGDSQIKSNFEIRKENGIKILRVKVLNQKSLSLPRRLLFELVLQKKIWKIFKKELANQEIELLIAHSPTIFWSFILKRIKQSKNPFIYLVLRDIFPKWALDTKIISRINPVYWFLRWHEKKLYDQVDVIGTQSKSNQNYFLKGSFNKTFDTQILYNWKRIGSKSKFNENFRRKYDLKDKVIFVFGGNLGFAQDIDNLLRLVSSFKNTDKIHFLFIGEGTEYKRIELWINENGIDSNLKLLPAVSNKEYQSILQECDVGIVSLRKDFKTDNFPNKILNYMEYKLPILASINPGNELKDFINKHGNGLVSDNGEDEILFNHAKELLESELRRKEMGEKGYSLLVETFNVKSAANQIVKAKNT